MMSRPGMTGGGGRPRIVAVGEKHTGVCRAGHGSVPVRYRNESDPRSQNAAEATTEDHMINVSVLEG